MVLKVSFLLLVCSSLNHAPLFSKLNSTNLMNPFSTDEFHLTSWLSENSLVRLVLWKVKGLQEWCEFQLHCRRLFWGAAGLWQAIALGFAWIFNGNRFSDSIEEGSENCQWFHTNIINCKFIDLMNNNTVNNTVILIYLSHHFLTYKLLKYLSEPTPIIHI